MLEQFSTEEAVERARGATESPAIIMPVLRLKGGVTGSGGRMRMPQGNRVSSSAALKMTGIWTQTIGYDPYAADGENEGKSAAEKEEEAERQKGIMELARLQVSAQNIQAIMEFRKVTPGLG